MPKLRRALLLVGLAFTYAPVVSPLDAQSAFELSPLFGYYAPTGTFAPASVYSTALPSKPSDLSGVAWGAEASMRFSRRFGVQVLAAVANSTLGEVITPDGPRGPTPAQVLVVTAEVRYELLRTSESTNLWLSAGPGLVRHQGKAYSESGAGAPVSAGAAIGVGLEIPVARHLRATAGLELLAYQLDIPFPPQLRGNPGEFESGFQRDLFPHIGMAWRW